MYKCQFLNKHSHNTDNPYFETRDESNRWNKGTTIWMHEDLRIHLKGFSTNSSLSRPHCCRLKRDRCLGGGDRTCKGVVQKRLDVFFLLLLPSPTTHTNLILIYYLIYYCGNKGSFELCLATILNYLVMYGKKYVFLNFSWFEKNVLKKYYFSTIFFSPNVHCSSTFAKCVFPMWMWVSNSCKDLLYILYDFT